MSVYVTMKAIKLTRIVNELFLAVEFESEDGRKYANTTTLNDIEVSEAARQVQVIEQVDMVIDAAVELCKTLLKKHMHVRSIERTASSAGCILGDVNYKILST